ncbi:hypothetical protein BDK51DRAFT_6184, partial [Blyttiomyces helicus]
VLIVGAGLSGLSLARSLASRGVPFKLFDAWPESRRPGYSLTLHPASLSPLLETLRAEPATFRASVAVAGTGNLGGIVDALTGEPVGSATGGVPGSFRANRFRLREWLREGVEVRFDHKLVGLEAAGRFTSGGVIAKFENGESVEGCLLVGADGVHSTVRNIVFPTVRPSILSTVVYNGQRRIPRPGFDSNLGPHFYSHTYIIGLCGRGGASVLSVGINDISAERVDLSWTYSRPAQEGDDALHRPTRGIGEAREIPNALWEELSALGPLRPPFDAVADPELARGDRINHWLMRSVRISREELAERAAGNAPVVLVGDAAHAMPIFRGEGGNHALLDGVELADAIAQHGAGSDALRVFYERATPRWEVSI